jgi:hypothetical protein
MRIDEAIELAESLARLPRERVTPTINELTHSRKLSETVEALNMLVLDHSRHRPVAIAALENLGMWVRLEHRNSISAWRGRDYSSQ